MSSNGGHATDEPRIVALLRLASEIGQTTLCQRLESVGYTELRPAHFRLLRFPGPHGVRPTDLAHRLGTSKQAINPLINDLERWGYLERRPDPRDQRGRVLWLTDRGLALMATIKALHAQIEADWADELGRRRFQILRKTLRDLVELRSTAAQSTLPPG
jgi:DNA-binding MarR family transcriptional regulator